MKDYQKQANDFLEKTSTTFSAEFLTNDFYFSGDKKARDIYKITFKRGTRKMSLKFGQSIINSGFYYTMGKKVVPIDRAKLSLSTDEILSFVRKDSHYQFLNDGKSDVIHYPVAPTAYNVLACLQKYEVGTFEDFCGDFGYDTDSRSAKKTYKAVRKEFEKVKTIWTDTEIEEMQEIQ